MQSAEFERSDNMSEICKQCGEQKAVAQSLHWYSVFLLLFSGTPGWTGGYCADCAGGRNVMAFLVGAAVVFGILVLAVVLL